MITNPEYLPKDRLKQELRKHGISFNTNENKDYYVQLYRDEVMQGKEPEKGRSEFSSDEEFVKQSPRPSKKQTKVCVWATGGWALFGIYRFGFPYMRRTPLQRASEERRRR